MNYGKINTCDTANGIGCRVSLFVSGCRLHCPGCHNQIAWDYHYGHKYTRDTEKIIMDALSHDFIDGLTVLGGEPLDVKNAFHVFKICKDAKALGKSVWVYTGYRFENVANRLPELLDCVDILVDGPFIKEEHDISLRFRGSRNQRIIDVRKSFKSGYIVPWLEEE